MYHRNIFPGDGGNNLSAFFNPNKSKRQTQIKDKQLP